MQLTEDVRVFSYRQISDALHRLSYVQGKLSNIDISRQFVEDLALICERIDFLLVDNYFLDPCV